MNKKHLFTAMIVSMFCIIKGEYTHYFENHTPYDVELFVGYKGSELKLCKPIGKRVIKPGELSQENAGICIIGSVQGYWPHNKTNSNKLGTFIGSATYAFTGDTPETFKVKQVSSTSLKKMIADGIQDTGEAFVDAGKQLGNELARTGEAIGNCLKDSKIARALDMNARIGALLAAEQVAQGALTLAEQSALTTLKAARETVKGSLNLAQGFLDEVVTRASTAVLVGPAKAAKGVLDAAELSATGVIEGGKFVLDQTLNLFDINCIHFDADQQALAQGNLGRGVVRGKIIKDFSLEVNFDAKSVGSSLQSLVDVAEQFLKTTFIDPIVGAGGQDFDAQLATVKNNEHLFDEKVLEIAALKAPEGLAKAQEAYQDALQKLATFSKEQQEYVQKEIGEQKLGAQRILADMTAKTYDQLLDEIKRMKASRQFDSKLRLLEIELLKRTALLRGNRWVPDEVV